MMTEIDGRFLVDGTAGSIDGLNQGTRTATEYSNLINLRNHSNYFKLKYKDEL